MIDLRSDTITRPTAEMRRVISEAEVGDDVFGEDPAINHLQKIICELTGKEAALFVASGTMGNQLCIKGHTVPGNEVILDRLSHIFNYECGAPGFLSGVQLFPVTGNQGHFTIEQVQEVIRPVDDHHPVTTLIALENTHNRAGGTIFPIEEIKRISSFAREAGIKLHLDGARLWNASVKTGIPIQQYCDHFDSVSLCFSKGLGAPVGSIIASSAEFIDKARYYRKALGGGMRQAGILAAAAIFALKNNVVRLDEDHRKAKELGEFIASLPGVNIDLDALQTNIIIFDVKGTGFTGSEVIQQLASKNVKMLTFGGTKIRAVTHLQISDSDIEETKNILQKIFHHN